MRTLYIHADYMEFETKKPTPVAEKIPDDQHKGRAEEVLVAFITVEKQDQESQDQVAELAVKNLLEILTKVKAERVLLYPYAHLSSELSDPETGKKMLRTMESMLKDKGVEVSRAPFGWYKAFKISCKGHPLSELSREIRVAPKKTEVVPAEQIDNVALLKQISKAKLSKENLKDNDHRILGQKLDLFSF
jgi:threonyl-tRNA synthetase